MKGNIIVIDFFLCIRNSYLSALRHLLAVLSFVYILIKIYSFNNGIKMKVPSPYIKRNWSFQLSLILIARLINKKII